MSQVFGDIVEIDNCIFDGDMSSTELDCDTWNGEWDDLLDDDSLFELVVDNLSLSELNISADTSHEQSGNFELPMAALAALDQISSYCAWHGDPNSAHVDALTMNWSSIKFLCLSTF